MSSLSKLFSIVFLGCLSLISIQSLAMTTTNTEELYADNLHLERSKTEIPKSIDSDAPTAEVKPNDAISASADEAPVIAQSKKSASN